MTRRLLLTLALFVAGSAATLAKDMPMPMSGSAVSPEAKAYAKAMDSMMGGMHVKPTGNPDRDFVLMMLPHHEGAVAMAKIQLQYGKDPELRAMATDIVAAQEKEIDAMKAWLAAHP